MTLNNIMPPSLFFQYQLNSFSIFFTQLFQNIMLGTNASIYSAQQIQTAAQTTNQNTSSSEGSQADKPAEATETSENNSSSVETSQSSDNNSNKTEHKPQNQTLTPQLKNQILNGTYSGPYVKINGITHYKYEDCPQSKLVKVGKGYLHKDAAAAFNKMKAAAAKEGITLTAYSPFRSKSTQIANFRNKMSSKHRTFEENLKWSAPGGYSEHHTGYAVDICNVNNNFANSEEYKWLTKHASEYGFELSFPKNNAQGIGFEPWHWRFIGTEEAKQTFAAARANI